MSLRVIATAPAAAEGLDCELEEGDCGFSPRGPLSLRFDRWLLPTTATRQSLFLITAGTGFGITLYPNYDVATRVIRYEFEPIPAGVVYTLRTTDADQDPNGFGFRAFDGEALDSNLTIAFRTSLDSPSEGNTPTSPPAPTCGQVVATFATAGCSRVGCHSRQSSPQCANSSAAMAWDESVRQCVNVPRMGLLLDDAQGLTTTAVSHVAHETQVGPAISRGYVSNGPFGDQMPIIDPGRPENSYLIYKLLISEQFNRELQERSDPNDPLSPSAMTREQISHARDWFIRFGPMPPDEVGTPSGASLYETYQIVARWIRAGATCSN